MTRRCCHPPHRILQLQPPGSCQTQKLRTGCCSSRPVTSCRRIRSELQRLRQTLFARRKASRYCNPLKVCKRPARAAAKPLAMTAMMRFDKFTKKYVHNPAVADDCSIVCLAIHCACVALKRSPMEKQSDWGCHRESHFGTLSSDPIPIQERVHLGDRI